MTTIVTRAGKGSPLTNNEVDTNFTNLNDAKVEVGGDLSGTALSPTVSKIQNRAVAATAPADGDAYVWDAATSTWVPGPAGGGAGTITGPASSTDNALVRWDGTTGTAIKNSGSTLDSTGVLSTPATVVTYTQFDTAATPPTIVDGTLAWDNYNGTAQLGLKGGNTKLQIGQELVARVYNNSGVALSDGQIVYIDGAQINRISVDLARANIEATSANTLGMVTEPIAIGAEGFITLMGQVNGLNTAGLTSGGAIYLSPTTAGAFTQTKPTAPNQTVILGWVERVDATTGSIYIKVDNGYELDELHNVQITTPTGGNLISYDQTAGYWKNVNLTDGTGISIAEATNGTVTVTNTAPDQTVAFTNGTGISVTGTYPNFTVTNTAPSSGGTVTSVGGTGTVNGITLTGTVTASGNLTLGGTLSGVDLTTQVSGTLPIANGGTGLTSVGVNGTVLTSDGTTASWVAPAGGGASYVRTSFTATAGQTTFSVAYTVGYVEVYVNGVLLNASDYTASSGTSVVLSTACVVNDIVEFIAYNTITTAITNANNLIGGAASQIPYQTGSGTTSFIANGTSGQVLTSNGASAPAWSTPAASNVQTFTGSGTWTKPSGAQFVMVEIWGAGGGGASGSRKASGTNSFGGGGGGGGAYVNKTFLASDLTSTISVTIGAGGTGGAARTTNDTNQAGGVVGGNTTFGTYLTTYGGAGGDANNLFGGYGGAGGGSLSAGVTRSGNSQARFGGDPSGTYSGAGGGGGVDTNGLPLGSIYGGAAGGSSVTSLTDYGLGAGSVIGGSGGGAGGGYDSANVTYVAYAGGKLGTVRGGGGAVGTAGSAFMGGGGNSINLNGANGGTASGGGGGGGSRNGTNSGAGGVGGAGYCVVYSW